MRSDIETAVRTILAEQALLSPEAVTADATLADLALDSLAMVEAIFALEERFDISIPFNANTSDTPEFDLSSVQSIVRAIETLIAQKAA